MLEVINYILLTYIFALYIPIGILCSYMALKTFYFYSRKSPIRKSDIFYLVWSLLFGFCAIVLIFVFPILFYIFLPFIWDKAEGPDVFAGGMVLAYLASVILPFFVAPVYFYQVRYVGVVNHKQRAVKTGKSTAKIFAWTFLPLLLLISLGMINRHADVKKPVHDSAWETPLRIYPETTGKHNRDLFYDELRKASQ